MGRRRPPPDFAKRVAFARVIADPRPVRVVKWASTCVRAGMAEQLPAALRAGCAGDASVITRRWITARPGSVQSLPLDGAATTMQS